MNSYLNAVGEIGKKIGKGAAWAIGTTNFFPTTLRKTEEKTGSDELKAIALFGGLMGSICESFAIFYYFDKNPAYYLFPLYTNSASLIYGWVRYERNKLIINGLGLREIRPGLFIKRRGEESKEEGVEGKENELENKVKTEEEPVVINPWDGEVK